VIVSFSIGLHINIRLLAYTHRGKYILEHQHPDSLSFLKFFSECWLVGPPHWSVGPLQLSFPIGSNLSLRQ